MSRKKELADGQEKNVSFAEEWEAVLYLYMGLIFAGNVLGKMQKKLAGNNIHEV